ncbi:DNA polymerase-like [Mercurialis annua]|uniref:DNA polymerase-like n=1 Tax=Mercurialis annua TaxID=3986 RepID=UPI00215EEC2C|nr:DNA polymerase-like [Mercurialis annua]
MYVLKNYRLLDKKKTILFNRAKSYYTKNKSNFYKNWYDLESSIEFDRCTVPYPGLRIAEIKYKENSTPQCGDSEMILLAVLRLLFMYIYNLDFQYGKFTISYRMEIFTIEDEIEILSYTIGPAISLNDEKGIHLPIQSLLPFILKYLLKKAKEYKDFKLTGIFIRAYLEGINEKDSHSPSTSPEKIAKDIWNNISLCIEEKDFHEPEAKSMVRKRAISPFITALKEESCKDRKSFIVADTETILIDNVHVPYAAAFLVVKPDENLSLSSLIEVFFSEDHNFFISSFQERSYRVLFDFLNHIERVATKTKSKTVYFHNFSRFDGIFFLEYLAKVDKYYFKALIRNNKLYEMKVYKKGKSKNLLFSLRDSLTILPNSLKVLAKSLCPHLGTKGEIQHDALTLENLMENREIILEYMKQDIRLLGGVMVKAQSLLYSLYKLDIVSCLTLSVISLKIFHMKYYDFAHFPIHIPSSNEDTFIRRAYYGGHAETYIPRGQNLYYYDVNSLYPYIMKNYPMPGGVPIWHGNLKNEELDGDRLLFPTGEFVGVYYSEELLFARELGYMIRPLRGYLFEKKDSPFDSFVTDIYNERLNAKKRGDNAMTYCYKILLNSLYGRFGINPETTITEVCEKNRYTSLIKKKKLMEAHKLSDIYYIVKYLENTFYSDENDYQPPRISAVHLSAAITACSRIYMYKYISRPDCYYTDTDSTILGSPLPDEDISSNELGGKGDNKKCQLCSFMTASTFREEDSSWVEPSTDRFVLLDSMKIAPCTACSALLPSFNLDIDLLTEASSQGRGDLGSARRPMLHTDSKSPSSIPASVSWSLHRMAIDFCRVPATLYSSYSFRDGPYSAGLVGTRL